MAELDRAMQLAYAAGNAAPVVTAIRLKCELNRLIVRQEEVGKPGESTTSPMKMYVRAARRWLPS